MTEKPSYARRRYFINRKFQLEFSIKFLMIIAVASLAVLVLFYYNSRGTLTAGYTGSEVKLLQTSAYFLPSLLLSTAGIIMISCLAGIFALILISHRLAGPLFRFQKSLDELGTGDLTRRFNLRDKDQFKELADRINALAAPMDGKIGVIRTRADEMSLLLADLQAVEAAQPALQNDAVVLLREMDRKLAELRDAAAFFKTSPPDTR